MSITCVIRQKNSDSLQEELTLQCIPAVGDTIYIDNQCSGLVESITHQLSKKDNEHKITINLKSS